MTGDRCSCWTWLDDDNLAIRFPSGEWTIWRAQRPDIVLPAWVHMAHSPSPQPRHGSPDHGRRPSKRHVDSLGPGPAQSIALVPRGPSGHRDEPNWRVPSPPLEEVDCSDDWERLSPELGTVGFSPASPPRRTIPAQAEYQGWRSLAADRRSISHSHEESSSSDSEQ